MAAWTSDELDKFAATEELQLASSKRDGSLRKPVLHDRQLDAAEAGRLTP